jgi:DNA-binding response OmpR family regulator
VNDTDRGERGNLPMSAGLREAVSQMPAGCWKALPPRLRVLYISSPHRTGGWLAEAFASDSASDMVLEEAQGRSAGISRLREEVYDAVLLSHDPDHLDALELLEGMKAGVGDQPVIVLGDQSEQEMMALCFEVGADGYACVNTTTTRTLIWTVARAVERHRLLRENRKFTQTEQHRLRQQHAEAIRLINEQRAFVRDVVSDEQSEVDQSDIAAGLPANLVTHYRELLRAYVVMGDGNLAEELGELAELLAATGFTATQTMELHLHVLEELVRGLGSRSSRHVMTRADLLILQLMVRLTEGYRHRYFERQHPPRQLTLPGFDDEPAPTLFVRVAAA